MNAGHAPDQLDQAIARIRGQAKSADRMVAVEADVTGRITDLLISPHARELEPEVLAAKIVEQHRAARMRAEELSRQAITAMTDRGRE
ncbi:YbaB/EbfC family nucleoid-associated protein [Nocardia sp. NPDC052001]|uniref:YbaB/EbfC family nucleoid-associated protein n=1 Tax=Nocardia sp. NPDC052001 TaxID=3154853 RepID=UPI00342695FE